MFLKYKVENFVIKIIIITLIVTFTPLNDNILVKPIEEPTVSGIILPPSKKQKAIVIAVSKDLTISLKPDDIVMYDRERGIPVEDMVIVKPNDLIIL